MGVMRVGFSSARGSMLDGGGGFRYRCGMGQGLFFLNFWGECMFGVVWGVVLLFGGVFSPFLMLFCY